MAANKMAANANQNEALAEREFIIVRDYEAPARLLFEAYSKPEHIKQWFGPVDYPVTECEMDFREGGRFRFVMTGPDGELGPPFGGEYLEIVRNRKIVYDNAFEAPGSEKMLVTVTFDEAGGKTRLTINTQFANPAMKVEYLGLGYSEGTNSALDLLGKLLTRMQAG